jgi:phasin
MADMTEAAKDTMKKAAKTAKVEVAKFETAASQYPEMFREAAEKSVEQAKQGYTRIRTAAEDATDLVEDTYLTATRGATEFNLKAIDALRANVNSSFDYARELLAAKSFSEAMEISATHMRQQVEAFSEQAREFSALAQKVATDTSEPFKSSVAKNFRIN